MSQTKTAIEKQSKQLPIL